MMNKLITTTIGTGLNILSHIAPEKSGQLGFQLFCYPVRPRLLPKHRQFLQAARHKSLRFNGEEIQVYKWGQGPRNIFFAHGWQSHSYRWKPYIEQLNPEEYSIYAVDAPAHGLSSGRIFTVPFYGEVIRKVSDLAGEWYAMAGHSLGSFSLLYTVREFETVSPEKLILLAPPSGAWEFVQFYKDTLNLSEKTVRLTVEQFTNRMSKPPEYYSAVNFAEGLKIPGLIIHDEGDVETTVENAREIHRRWPASYLIETKGFGHNLRSPSVVEDVIQFINRSH